VNNDEAGKDAPTPSILIAGRPLKPSSLGFNTPIGCLTI
jgi:hypothetical protein